MGMLGQLANTGLSALGGGLGSGLAGAAVSGISSLLSGDQTKKAYQYQQKLQDSQNAWQAEQNKLAQQYQSDEWTRQFNATNEYNSPSAQVQRMIDAGLNPASLSGASGTSSASVTGNSGHANGTPVGNLGAPIAGMKFDAMNSVSSAIKALTSGARDLSETNRTNTLLPEEVRNLIAKTNNEETQTMLTDMQHRLLKEFGSKREQAQINSLVAACAREYADAEKAYAEVDDLAELKKLHKAQTNASWSQKALYDADVRIKGRQRAILDKELAYFDSWKSAEINSLYAAAQERLANARSTNYDADLKQVAAELVKHDGVARQTFIRSIRDEWANSSASRQLTEQQRDFVEQQIQLLGKQTDEFELWKTLDFLQSVGMSFAVGGLFKGALKPNPFKPIKPIKGFQ